MARQQVLDLLATASSRPLTDPEYAELISMTAMLSEWHHRRIDGTIKTDAHHRAMIRALGAVILEALEEKDDGGDKEAI